MMKALVAVVGIVCLLAGVYLGWTFKPSSASIAEGLVLSTIGALTEGQVAAERAEYEAQIEQTEQVISERTSELLQAHKEREQAEERALQAEKLVVEARAMIAETRREVEIAHTQATQAVTALEQSPEDVELLQTALFASQNETSALREDNGSLRSALGDTRLQVIAEQSISHALRGELLASVREKVAIIAQRDLALNRVDQLTKRRVRVGPGVTGGWSMFGGSLQSADVLVGLTVMWG